MTEKATLDRRNVLTTLGSLGVLAGVGGTATESASTPGATRRVTFTADERMSRYYCENHPQRMRRDVSVGNL